MIAVDWGGTSLRAYRLDAKGDIVDRRRADVGALDCDGRHAAVLARCVEGWDDANILLCGTIGTRGAWCETPYVDCPADAAALASALQRVDTAATPLQNRSVRIVPGVIDRSGPVADVMRGEETQVVGLPEAVRLADTLVCLPGTHSKWVTLRGGAIASLRTALTDEAYAMYHRHSILARSLAAGDGAPDDESFDAGLRRSGDPGGLLHHVFGVRTESLLGKFSPTQASAWLSGLLIGHELRAMLPLPAHVHVIGSARLVNLYARAIASFGARAQLHSEELAARGMHTLAMRRGR